MKPAKTKRKRTIPRKPPSESDVRFVIATLASFGGRAGAVPTDIDPPESWEAWRVGRAKEVAIPLRVLDHAAATLLALLECSPLDRGPPGVRADPAVAEALRIAELAGMTKIDAARYVIRLRAWRKRCEKADRRAKERAEARRKDHARSADQEGIPDEIRGYIEDWRTQKDEHNFQVEEREKADAADCEPEAADALEAEAKRLARAMEPSRGRPAKLKR